MKGCDHKGAAHEKGPDRVGQLQGHLPRGPRGQRDTEASRLSDYYCESAGLLPEIQCGFRPGHSTIEMMCVVLRLQEHDKEKEFLCICA